MADRRLGGDRPTARGELVGQGRDRALRSGDAAAPGGALDQQNCADNAVVARNLVQGQGFSVDYVAQFYRDWPTLRHPAETWPPRNRC
ncbi:MAG: hypothetical protein U0841_12620 [Chloroflexia bacterium]